MKKAWISALLALCLLGLTACGQAPAGESAPPDAASAPPAAEGRTTASPGAAAGDGEVLLLCRIVDGAAEGDLLLAEQGADANGVYRLSAGDLPVTLDGASATAEDLEDGMLLEVGHDGMVLETFPAQFANVTSLTATSPLAGGTTDLCGLYLQVMEDLWAKDEALNGNLSTIGLDLSNAPGDLNPAEKAAVAWRFGELHGLPVVTGTWEELVDQGYITGTPLGDGASADAKFHQWKDGVLLAISANPSHEGEAYTLPILFFDALKWRSSTGSYFFYDCSALWPEQGTWTGYQVGDEMIS